MVLYTLNTTFKILDNWLVIAKVRVNKEKQNRQENRENVNFNEI